MEKAIIIGGSIAGNSCQALSHTFRELIILEAGERWTEKAARQKSAIKLPSSCFIKRRRSSN